MVTNILLALLLVVQVAVIAGLAWLYIRVKRTIDDFIIPPAPDKPSALAVAVDTASSFLARSLLAQAKGFLMGLQSGQNRSERAVQADLTEGLASQHPLGALLMSFPALRKSIRRNPAMLDVALAALTKNMPGSGFHPSNGNPSESPKFNL